MLDTIKKLESELAEKVTAAKHDASTAVQQARTVAADERALLEEKLRTEEATAISKAEAAAQTEAAKTVAAAQKNVTAPDQKKIDTIATEIVNSLIS